MRRFLVIPLVALLSLLAGCSSAPVIDADAPVAGRHFVSLSSADEAEQVVLYAYGLIGTGYRFGGRNPEAGLDCSGMVSYIVEQVSGQRLPHNAAQIAAQTRPIRRDALQPGDLVFFNTLNRRHSHMGIYLGEGRFIHAPSSNGSVRIDRLSNRYFSTRFDGARTLLPAI
ncbi:C40 family peptidase [Nitrogeniibacter mangrovi]|uniref:C40 family peptidase n=1 Tax=Nitrogeniibacter mangrovi TaxID=2016596 RepID=A0A6C1B2L0_9RHOO|nr:C40 family peptidase [Nitrogeniibacter mangrovi]QID17881.1 C40 family peptidase [Nitrogeniibacter mangrovi]